MKNLVRNSAYSVAETCWGGLTLFLLFKYVAAHLGVAAIGAWSLLVTTMSISSIADIGLGRALLHFVPIAIARSEQSEAASYVETAAITVGTLFLLIMALAFPVLVWVIREFVAPTLQDQTIHILPYALLSFWLSNVSLVFLSGVAGMQRYDIRSIVSMTGSATQLLVAVISIKKVGFLGLVLAQMAQNAVLVVGAAISLREILPQLHSFPVRFSLAHFKMMRSYGTSLQAYTFVTFIFEPTTKIALSHFGGLPMVGFYEMASRLANQVRTLLVNAIQVLVPGLAELHQRDKARAFQAYLRMTETIWILACPIMATVAIFLPQISALWLGRQSHEFITFSLVVLVGWTINMICAPAFFMGLASGFLRWNLIGMTISASINLLLAPLLGFYAGPLGVVVAFSLSLSVGSFTLLLFNHLKFGGSVGQIINARTLQMVGMLVSAVAVGILTYDSVRSRVGLVASIGFCMALIGSTIWIALALNPATANLLSLLRSRYLASRRTE